jgi:hypothetical protein
VNSEDKAAQSRKILIPFAKLEEQDREFDDWGESLKLLSCLPGDMMSFLFRGKLDSEAISHCAKYLGAVCGRHKDRNVDCHAMLLYFRLMLSAVAQASSAEYDSCLKWFTVTLTKHLSKYQTVLTALEELILQVDEIRRVKADFRKDFDKTTGVHNFLAHSRPAGRSHNSPWYALRLDSLAAVIKFHTGIMIDPDLLYEMASKNAAFSDGSALFYDQSLGTPKAIDCDPMTNARTERPLHEQELDESQVLSARCLFVMQKEYKRMVKKIDSHSELSEGAYKTVELPGQDGEPYNFWEAVTFTNGGSWWGYRGLIDSTFAPFCGISNQMFLGSPIHHKQIIGDCEDRSLTWFGDNLPDVEVETMQDCFRPDVLLGCFGYSAVSDGLPPCYTELPYLMRNESSHGDKWVDEDDPYPDKKLWSGPRCKFNGVSRPPTPIDFDFSGFEGNDDMPFSDPSSPEVDKQSNEAGAPDSGSKDPGSILRERTNEAERPAKKVKVTEVSQI